MYVSIRSYMTKLAFKKVNNFYSVKEKKYFLIKGHAFGVLFPLQGLSMKLVG